MPILVRCCIARSVALCVSRKASRQAVGVLDRYDQNVRQPVLVKIPKTVLRAVLSDVPHFSMMIWPPTSPGHRFAAWDRADVAA